MSSQSKNKSIHYLVKSAVSLIIIGFGINAYLQFRPSMIYTVALSAAILGAVFIISLLNYNDFQRYGFIPIILISLNEIFRHLMNGGHELVEVFYYLAVILISIYFMSRIKKRKYRSPKK